MAENAMVRANQKNAIANTIKAGNKLTDAQKKNFSAAEIAAIRKSVNAGTWRGAKGADTRIHKKGEGQRLRKTFGTKSVYSGKTTGSPKRKRSATGTGKGKAAVSNLKKKKAAAKRADTRQRTINKAREYTS